MKNPQDPLEVLTTDDADELRMYIVVRKDVGEAMSKPKFGVQCSHATLSCWIACLLVDPDRAWAYWNASQPKIVMEVRDQDELLKTYHKAFDAGFYVELIKDAARTEFSEPTLTAIAIGPVWYEAEAQAGFIKRLQVYKEVRAV